MILVDTSVWVDVLRKRDPLDLEAVVEIDEVVTCLPVVQEILQGIGEQRAYRVAREALLSMPLVESPMPDEVFIEAAELYRAARRTGHTVRSSLDCLIAACAIRHDLTVLHRARDYPALAQVSPLRQEALPRPH